VAARKSIRVQGEVDGVAWSWAGPSAGYGHFGVGDESPPFACLDLVAASIGLKILGRGKLSLSCSSVSSTSVVSSLSPNHCQPASCYSAAYNTHCVVALPCDCNFNIIYSLRIYCVFASRASSSLATRLEVDVVDEQAHTDATPWRCLNVGILFDLPVDAACKVIGILGFYNRRNSFLLATLFDTDSPQYCL
jgi:hypothetical protein